MKKRNVVFVAFSLAITCLMWGRSLHQAERECFRESWEALGRIFQDSSVGREQRALLGLYAAYENGEALKPLLRLPDNDVDALFLLNLSGRPPESRVQVLIEDMAMQPPANPLVLFHELLVGLETGEYGAGSMGQPIPETEIHWVCDLCWLYQMTERELKGEPPLWSEVSRLHGDLSCLERRGSGSRQCGKGIMIVDFLELLSVLMKRFVARYLPDKSFHPACTYVQESFHREDRHLRMAMERFPLGGQSAITTPNRRFKFLQKGSEFGNRHTIEFESCWQDVFSRVCRDKLGLSEQALRWQGEESTEQDSEAEHSSAQISSGELQDRILARFDQLDALMGNPFSRTRTCT